MLPFLKNRRQESSLIINTRKPDEGVQDEKSESDQALEACAKDLIDAIHAKDIRRTAEALRAASELVDMEPHIEGEHIEPGDEI